MSIFKKHAAAMGFLGLFMSFDLSPRDYSDSVRAKRILANTPGDMKPFSGKRKYKKPVGCNKPKKNKRALSHPYAGFKKAIN